MTSFCVFGVLQSACKKQVQKTLEPNVRHVDEAGGKCIRSMTPDEYSAAVAKATTALFIKRKPAQVSPAFDAPQFCEDWMAIAVRTNDIRSAKIMVRGEKYDKHGNQVLSKVGKNKGKPVITWVPYVEERRAV